LMGGHILKIEDVDKLPGARERDIFQSLGVRAALLLPLFSREVFFGFIGLEDYDEPRHWSAEEISLLQIAAEIMLRGIENKNLSDELAGHRRELQEQVDERTIELRTTNEQLRLEAEAHRKTIDSLKRREVELRNRNQAFEELSDRLSLLLQEGGKTIVDIEAMLADRIRARFRRAATAAGPLASNSGQVEFIQSSIEEITAPLKGSRFDLYAQFTPAEIKIAEFLKLGLASKEISRLLGISDRTVQVHCLKIREKLGLKNKKVNLKGYLMSL
jgi:DNA-binding CsgD family transcriptional regulator